MILIILISPLQPQKVRVPLRELLHSHVPPDPQAASGCLWLSPRDGAVAAWRTRHTRDALPEGVGTSLAKNKVKIQL